MNQVIWITCLKVKRKLFMNLLFECLCGRDSVRRRNRVYPEMLQKPENDSRDHVLGHAGQLGRDRSGPMGHVRAVVLGAKPTKD